MPELATEFQSLPEEYQLVIRLAEGTFKIAVAPLQLLVGGWSGAVVYLVSVFNNETKRVEHCILKLDRKGKSAKSDEVTRHNTLISKSTPDFARDHIAELVLILLSMMGQLRFSIELPVNPCSSICPYRNTNGKVNSKPFLHKPIRFCWMSGMAIPHSNKPFIHKKYCIPGSAFGWRLAATRNDFCRRPAR